MSSRKALGDLTEALKIGHGHKATSALLGLAEHGDGLAGDGHQMARLVFDIWQLYCGRGRAKAEGPSTEILAEVARWADAQGSRFHQACTALDYLTLWSEVDRYFRSNDLVSPRFDAASLEGEHGIALCRQVEACREKLSTVYGITMFEAMLASVTDRDRAAALFQRARVENEEFASAPYLDQYAATYFTSDTIHANIDEIETRRAVVMDSFVPALEGQHGTSRDTILLFSCDPFFFSVYFSYWASAVQYLEDQGVKMHFLIVGDEGETATACEKGLKLLNSLSALRGWNRSAPPGNLSFSRVAVPPFVSVPKTFYACARYLLARRVKDVSNARVLILDVDMTIMTDPTQFCEHVRVESGDCLPLLIGGGLASLIPARRYMANTFPVPSGDLGDRVMRRIEDYLYVGLSELNSWTLDQNALTYMVENIVEEAGPEFVSHLAKFGARPFAQLAPINRVYEIAQREREDVSVD